MIGAKEEIRPKEIKMMEHFVRESLELKKIKKLSSVEEISLLESLIAHKMKLVSAYLISRYEGIYSRILNYDNISKVKE
jgi:hypothetical protein